MSTIFTTRVLRDQDCSHNLSLRLRIAYHCHLQLGVVAQGLLQCLAILHPCAVWGLFGSWLGTVRPGLPPSERVVALSLRNALPDFLADDAEGNILTKFTKFIRKRIDPERAEGLRLASWVGTRDSQVT